MLNLTAAEFMQKLTDEQKNGGESNFDSPYSSRGKGYHIMKVNASKVFDDLSQEDKLRFSIKPINYPVLNIWTKTWMYITELEKWELISSTHPFKHDLSYNPSFVILDDEYILYVEDEVLYKRC